METSTNWIGSNGMLFIGIAAVLCGVALFYLVMSRTIKHREKTETPGQEQ